MTGTSSRISAAETRSRIIDAAAAVLEEHGASGLTVSEIMRRADVSRTAFYRQFSDVAGVVAALLELLLEELYEEAGDWFDVPKAVGHREIVWENALRDGRSIKPRIRLFSALVDATTMDESLRTLWRSTFTQSWIDTTAAAIRRDQEAGTVRPDLDPDATSLALTLMSVNLALEILGRQDGTPEQYAEVLAPIWETVLFGIDQSSV